MIASLVGDTWAQSITPMNILKKSRISPLNPSEVSDRMLAPAKVFKPSEATASSTVSPTFSDEQMALFEKRYSEGYDMTPYMSFGSRKHILGHLMLTP